LNEKNNWSSKSLSRREKTRNGFKKEQQILQKTQCQKKKCERKMKLRVPKEGFYGEKPGTG
jgi:hypothetical protein